MKIIKTYRIYILIALLLIFMSKGVEAFTEKDIPRLQASVSHLKTGDRIVFWARQFLGTAYDPEPSGTYVKNKVIVFDQQVNSMYLVCRAVELALSSTPHEAIDIALEKRFFILGVLKDNKVQNYNERYEYPMDMILSGKWGKDITEELGSTVNVEASRTWDTQKILPKKDIQKWIRNLQNGDLIFFVKDEKKRRSGELIGNMGIIEKAKNGVYVIHAKEGANGSVVANKLSNYLKSSDLIGVKVTRFR